MYEGLYGEALEKVAVKRMVDQNMEAAKREAASLQSLSHESVVRYYTHTTY